MKAKLKALTYIFIFLGMHYSATCQQATISSASHHSALGDYQVSWNVGQVVVGSLSNDNHSVSSGILVGSSEIAVVASVGDIRPEITIYPNPTSGLLSINPATGPYKGRIKLLSSAGNVVRDLNDVDFSIIQKIDVQDLSTGIYLLQVQIENQSIQQFKIIKN